MTVTTRSTVLPIFSAHVWSHFSGGGQCDQVYSFDPIEDRVVLAILLKPVNGTAPLVVVEVFREAMRLPGLDLVVIDGLGALTAYEVIMHAVSRNSEFRLVSCPAAPPEVTAP
jgi:hypothetical protein